MKKFYQVEPEYFNEEMFNELLEIADCTIIGNRYCRGAETENYKKVYKMLENIDDPDDIKNGYSYYNNFTEAINDYLPPLNKNNYEKKEIHKLKELVKNYYCGNYTEIVAEVLSIYTGEEYATGTLSGYCQGDWAKVIYKKDTDGKTIEWIEALLFGTYTEYMMDDEGETVRGYYVLDTENPEEKLREYEGDDDEIEIYNINGYITTPKYTKISVFRQGE